MLIGRQDHIICRCLTIFFGLKSQVYKNSPQSIPELKDEVIRVPSDIELQ